MTSLPRQHSRPSPANCSTAAGLRSLAKPGADTTSDLAELAFAMFGGAAKLELDRTARGGADAKGMKFRGMPKPPRSKCEAIARHDIERSRSIDRSYDVSAAMIFRLSLP